MFNSKILKKSMAVTLSLAMTLGMANWVPAVGTSANGLVEVKADEAVEPTYNKDTDTLVMDLASEKATSGETKTFVSSIPEGRAYGLSFNLKMSGQMWFTYGNKATDRFLIQNHQYYTDGLKANHEWIQFKNLGQTHSLDTTAEKMTVLVKDGKLTLWLGGYLLVDNEEMSGDSIKGKFSAYFSEGAEMTDLKAWYEGKPVVTEEPVYSEEDGILLYDNANLIVADGKTEFLEMATIPSDSTFYFSYTLRTDANFYCTYRGESSSHQGQIFVGPTQYGIIGIEKEMWPQVAGLAKVGTGVRITIVSTPTKSTIYLNGEKVADKAALREDIKKTIKLSCYAQGGDATLKNVKVWTVSDEPKYHIENCTSKYYAENKVIATPSASTFGVTIPNNTEYCASFNVKSNGGFYFQIRGEGNEACKFYMDFKQYCLQGYGGKENWVSCDTKIKEGAKVTIRSSQNLVSIWLNNVKIINNCELTDNNGLKAVPGFFWVTDKTTVTNSRVWIEHDVVESSEPKYNSSKNVSIFEKAEATVNANSENALQTEIIPRWMDYYYSATFETSGNLYIDFRGSNNRLYIDNEQYAIIGTEKTEWVPCDTMLSSGMKLTIKSTQSSVAVWINGNLVVSNAVLKNAECAAQPCISRNSAETTVTDCIVWANDDEFDNKLVWAEDGRSAKYHVNNKTTNKSYVYAADVTVEELKKATCTEAGQIKAIAKIDNVTEVKESVVPAKGHNYKAKFTWAANNKSAKVTVTCANDSKDSKTYTAKVTSKVTKKATYFAKGVTTYTATYGKYSENKKVENIKKLILGKTKSVTVTSPKAKQIKVSLKKVTGAKKYEIQYSTNKKFKKAKSVTAGKTTCTIKKLSSKKKYYVRVRAVATSGKAKVTGSWVSAKKAVKVK